MPARRDQVRQTKRVLDANARRTSDVVVGRQVGSVGLNFDLVVVDDECSTELLIKSETPGVSACPETQVQVLNAFGGARSLVLASAPTGRQGAGPLVVEEIVTPEIGIVLALTYIGFTRDDSTHLTVTGYDQNGDVFSAILSNIVIPTGSINAGNVSIAIVTGDDNLPDNSFTFITGTDIEDAEKLYMVNSETGAFTLLFDSESSGDENFFFHGTFWEDISKKIFFVTLDEVDKTIIRLRSVNADGSGLTLVKTDTAPAQNYRSGACIWDSDRVICFWQNMSSCNEIPFDGGSVVQRTGNSPLNNQIVLPYFPQLYPSKDRYFADLDAGQDYFEGARMPLTSGSAVSLNWPTSTFFPAQQSFSSNIASASVKGTDLVLWPITLVKLNKDNVHILRVDRDSVPTVGDLIQVTSAIPGDLGLIEPFEILVVP